MVRLQTRAVLAGAYRGQMRSTLTHTVAVNEDGSDAYVKYKCVEVDSLADEHASDPNAPPTCKKCLRRDPRFQGSP